jgi:crotonobetainyl-CoA:carnitine CoA-transferase CaiB-like acyl-CoA transferase
MQDLADQLEVVGVPAGPINNLDQVFDDPHIKHRGMKLDLSNGFAKDGTIPGVRTPITIDGKPMASPHAAPRLGEHTAEILREIGEG